MYTLCLISFAAKTRTHNAVDVGQRRSGREEGMEPPEQLHRDFEALQERLSRLSQASLRINESLDVDAALQAGSTGYAHRLRPGHE